MRHNKLLACLGITGVKNKEWKTIFTIAFAAIVLIISILYDFIRLRDAHTNLSLFIIGAIIIVIGIILRITGAITLGKYFSLHIEIANNHKIIKKGIFRYIRHPMYLASLMIGMGAVIMFASWIGLIVYLLIFIPIFVHRIKLEEKYLLRRFDDEYRRYIKQTAALIPGIW